MSEPVKPEISPRAASHAPSSAGAEQLPLLPAPGAAERDALLPMAELAKSRTAPPGAGRPLGARNRRSDLMARYCIERYGDPLEADVALGMAPLRELIPELRKIASDCGMQLDLTVGELLRIQAEARNRALPFLHAKRAPEDAKGDPVLPIIGIGRAQNVTVNAAPARSIEDQMAERARVIDVVPNQGVSDDKPK